MLGVAVGVAIYVGFSIWADAGKVGAALARFSWPMAALAFALAAVNYAFRWARWAYYLRLLDIHVPRGQSVLIFLGGFSLTVPPGKLGEVVKSFLLRESYGVPVARSAPIVVAERVTDLVGLLVLSAAGAFTFDVDRRFLLAACVLLVVGLAVISFEPLARAVIRVAGRLPALSKVAHKLDEFYGATRVMLRPGPLLGAVALASVSWFFECLAFFVVVGGFPGADLSLFAGTFIYAAMTIAGALTFLPGGLGVTEGGMLLLLGRFARGVDQPTAAAATFITRVATLWFAVALGLGSLALFSRRRAVDLGGLDGARG